jgi:hypothetical protein
MGEPAALIGTGALGLCATVGFAAAGRRGAEGATAETGDAEPGLDVADAETVVVCGSLGTLLNGLKSQDGASFDATDVRDALVSLECRGAVVEVEDFVDCTEWIDDCDGEVLRLVVLA